MPAPLRRNQLPQKLTLKPPKPPSGPTADTEKDMSSIFGSGSAASASNSNSNTTVGDISKDVALNSPPEDSISDLAFSPQSDHLAVASWDKKVRIYEINNQGGSEGKALFEHEGPVLSVHWSKVRPL